MATTTVDRQHLVGSTVDADVLDIVGQRYLLQL